MAINRTFSFFSSANSEHLESFLTKVAAGKQKDAEALIKEYPELLAQKGTLTDLSHRKFDNITGFQYALWARDESMWNMILKYLSPEQAFLQLSELEQTNSPHGSSFKMDRVNAAYTNYLSYYRTNILEPKLPLDISGKDKMLQELFIAIGKEQRLLPIHFINELLVSDMTMSDSAKINNNFMTRNYDLDRMMKVYRRYTWFSTVETSIYPLNDKYGLGIDYTLLHGSFAQGYTCSPVYAHHFDRSFYDAHRDADALSLIDKARNAQYCALKEAVTPTYSYASSCSIS